MGFSARQLQALRRQPNRCHIRTREAHGRELSSLEGWYAISEANRILGFDGWSRETLESRCVLARENRGSYLAVYVARVRVTVRADGATVIREGQGTGEGRGDSPGEVHDMALKAAETDAIKRALATFGKPFGLELYRGGRTVSARKPRTQPPMSAPGDAARVGFHPDDTTSIPRPSRYHGRREDQLAEHFRGERRAIERAPAMALPLAPTTSDARPTPIDKSQLTLAEPRRLRDKVHLKFVVSQPCLVCGRQPTPFAVCPNQSTRHEGQR
jgi:hypothetical protein